MSLSDLRKEYPYYRFSNEKPDIPFDPHGWFNSPNAELLKPLIKDTKIILELGSWLGCSTRFFLENSNATIICIDWWLGSAEHRLPGRDDVADKLPNLYEIFISNQWPWKDRIIPMRTTTDVGMDKIDDHLVNPDLIYIDASHDYADVYRDLKQAFTLFPNAIITGDDWNYVYKVPGREGKTVQKAVTDFCQFTGCSVETNKGAWRLVR